MRHHEKRPRLTVRVDTASVQGDDVCRRVQPWASAFSLAGFQLDSQQVLNRLQLKRTGELRELPDAPICGVTLESGWFVVVRNGDFRFVNPVVLNDLSFDTMVVAAALDDGPMTSEATAWRTGELLWTAKHDGSVGRSHFQLEGAAPREVHALLEAARANKKPFVDHLFPVPMQAVDAVMGFDFGEDQRFETLVEEPPAWRTFKHADGRVWAIRLNGAGYQLRIGAENDDPVLKQRASKSPLREIEQLIREQLADGFAGE